MAQLPGQFNDGDILFAGPMELIRDFLENSLAFRATAGGQILVSTGAGNMAGDNTELLQIPATGQGILRINADRSITLQNFNLIDGVVLTDTNLIPADRLPVRDFAITGGGVIPEAALPAIGGIVLDEVTDVTTTLTLQSGGNSTYRIITGDTFRRAAEYISPVMAIYYRGNTTGVNGNAPHFAFFREEDIPDISANTGGYIFSQSRSIQLHVGRHTGTDDLRVGRLSGDNGTFSYTIKLYKVREDASANVPAATEDEAREGTLDEIRRWSPIRVRQAASARDSTVDQTARDAADAAQADADVNEADIAANTVALADKVNSADLTTDIEGFAVVGNTDEIPTVRYALDSVTENKLSPQVRAKLAATASQQGENIEWASMTQVEYDALTSYDSDRLYIIVG